MLSLAGLRLSFDERATPTTGQSGYGLKPVCELAQNAVECFTLLDGKVAHHFLMKGSAHLQYASMSMDADIGFSSAVSWSPNRMLLRVSYTRNSRHARDRYRDSVLPLAMDTTVD